MQINKFPEKESAGDFLFAVLQKRNFYYQYLPAAVVSFIPVIKEVMPDGLLLAVNLFDKSTWLPLFNHIKHLTVYFGIIAHDGFLSCKTICSYICSQGAVARRNTNRRSVLDILIDFKVLNDA